MSRKRLERIKENREEIVKKIRKQKKKTTENNISGKDIK